MDPYAQKNQLSQEEVTETFVHVLSDIYTVKALLLNQLPQMTFKSKDLHLKMLIINAGASLKTQLLRLDTAMKQLKKERIYDDSFTLQGLNFEKYLLQDLSSITLYNDAKLLNHLLIIIGVQINSFRLLIVLSKRLSPKTIYQQMRLNLDDALKYQKILLDTYNSFIKITCGVDSFS